MNSQVRMVLTIALSVAAMFAWYYFFSPKQLEKNQAPVEQAQIIGQGAQVQEAPKPPPELIGDEFEKDSPYKEVKVENELYSVTLTNEGGVPVNWFLKDYNREAKGEEKIDVARVEGLPPQFMSVKLEDAALMPANPKFKITSSSDDEVEFLWKGKGIDLVKRYKFHRDNYIVDLEVEILNKSGSVLTVRPSVLLDGASFPKKSAGLLSMFKQPPVTNKSPVYYLQRKVKRESNVFKMPESSDVVGPISWAGLEDRYFLAAAVPRTLSDNMKLTLGSRPAGEKGEGRVLTSAIGSQKDSIPAGERKSFIFSIYAGPKDIDKLKAVGVGLDEAIDYGWFSIVAIPMLYLLKFFYGICKSWGVSILLLTLFIKLVMNPISKKSMKSMKAMQRLQPELKALQQKFKDDKSRLNQETMRLFQAHKVNPMSGCLPMLLQFPIYIALYRVLWNSVELFHAPFLYYPDLAAPDPFYITPVLLGIFMFLQQRMMPSTSADPIQQKMMMFMPIMFTAIMLFLPSGLVFYILISTVSGVAQQYMYNKGVRMRDLFTAKGWEKLRV